MNLIQYKIVQTDNYGGDYPDEKFVSPLPYFNTEAKALKVANAINKIGGEHSHRYYRVVKMPYKLQPGFEP